LDNDEFDAVSCEIDRPFAADKFQRFLEALPPGVFRAKGVLWIDGSEKPCLFHLVGQRFTLDQNPKAGPVGNRLVLIGRSLDPGRLRAELEACVA
jgi:G3E family GTPase